VLVDLVAAAQSVILRELLQGVVIGIIFKSSTQGFLIQIIFLRRFLECDYQLFDELTMKI
jgi:hypothetical protein